MRRDAVGALILIGAVLFGTAWAAPARAEAVDLEDYVDTALLPGQLVVNGDAEAGTAEGWDGPLAVYQHGVGGYPLSLIVDSSGFTGESYDGGEFLFTGVGPYSIATQSIDLTSAAPAIDNAHTRARISAYLGGHYVQSDRPILHYEFFDEAGALLESRQFGPVLPADRGSASGFIRFEETVL
ncbi:hypothetical protein, partial [Leucobacter aridicollis]|uniref:hypothetical protein n=1 Tax=Leucobacter aridicollis TaxID=283878 RepID=UPI0037C87D4C